MSDTVTVPPFPRLPLYSAGALVAFAIMAALAGHLSGGGKTVETGSPASANESR